MEPLAIWKVFLLLLFVASVLALFSENAPTSFVAACILLLYGLAVAPWIALMPDRLHSKLILSGRFTLAERLSKFMVATLEGANGLFAPTGINFDRELVAWQGNLAGALFSQGRLLELSALDAKRLVLAERLLSDVEIANIQCNVAAHFLKSGKFFEAANLINISLGVLKTFEVIKERELEYVRRKRPPATTGAPSAKSWSTFMAKCDLDLAEAEVKVAKTYLHMGLWTEAELYELRRDYQKEIEVRRMCLRLQEEVAGPGHPYNVHTMAALGLALCRAGRADEAEPLVMESYRLRTHFYAGQQLLVAYGMIAVAKLKWYQGQFTESEVWFEKALAIVQSMPAFTRVDEPEYLSDTAVTKMDLGKYAEAEDLLKKSMAGKLQFFVANHPEVAGIYEKYARLLSLTGRENEAQEWRSKADSIVLSFQKSSSL